MKEKTYANVVQLETDVKWFAHNCRISSSSQKVVKASKEIVTILKEDLKFILRCGPCYNIGENKIALGEIT